MDANRRIFFLRSAGLATAAATTGPAALAQKRQPAPSHAQHASHAGANAGADVYVFFNPDEAAFVEAAVARLIPTDALGPGAIEAGVPFFIDRQLAGAWGAGERLYRSGPWPAGTAQQGYQLPYTPAELFRTALGALREQAARDRGTPFARQSGSAQDELLRRLQAGGIDLGGVPSNVFFESLWALTLEGFFGDPVYGGNRGMVSWRMVGFPGAYANYYAYVDQHNIQFDGPPVSLADNGRGGVQIHTDIPATGSGGPGAPTAPARPAGRAHHG